MNRKDFIVRSAGAVMFTLCPIPRAASAQLVEAERVRLAREPYYGPAYRASTYTRYSHEIETQFNELRKLEGLSPRD